MKQGSVRIWQVFYALQAIRVTSIACKTYTQANFGQNEWITRRTYIVIHENVDST